MQLTKSTADANKPENSFLNRYRDVKPYDHTRVKLETHHDTDYINASLVKVTIISCKGWVVIFDITFITLRCLSLNSLLSFLGS